MNRVVTNKATSRNLSWMRALIFALLVAAGGLSAQTEAELNIGTYAGLTISGEIGSVYSIEYTTDPGDPDGSDWQCLEYLRLPTSPYGWTDLSTPAVGKRWYRAVAMEAPENMVFIPPGTFRMGRLTSDVVAGPFPDPQIPATAVTISRGFWMGRHEVTQGEYLAVMGNNPSFFQGIRDWPQPGTDYGTDLNRPVESVYPPDAAAYCAAITARDLAAGRIAAGSAYRLPTEAEWEYACRAWTWDEWKRGDEWPDLTGHAWYDVNSGDRTHPVGQKLPNAWGLHDVQGNVGELCRDWLGSSLPGGIVVDPVGETSNLAVRGGDWLSSAPGCLPTVRERRAANRPIQGYWNIGFRVVLAPVQP